MQDSFLEDDVVLIRSELQRTRATVTKSISETIAVVDNLQEKHNRFKNQVDGNLSAIQLKLNKLWRAQTQWVSTLPSFLNILILIFVQDQRFEHLVCAINL